METEIAILSPHLHDKQKRGRGQPRKAPHRMVAIRMNLELAKQFDARNETLGGRAKTIIAEEALRIYFQKHPLTKTEKEKMK